MKASLRISVSRKGLGAGNSYIKHAAAPHEINIHETSNLFLQGVIVQTAVLNTSCIESTKF